MVTKYDQLLRQALFKYTKYELPHMWLITECISNRNTELHK